MSVFTMVVWIVAICVIGDIFKRKMSTKNSKSDDKNHINNDQVEKLISINQQLNQQVKSLESRVIHLEAIVTDEGYDLKQKLSSL